MICERTMIIFAYMDIYTTKVHLEKLSGYPACSELRDRVGHMRCARMSCAHGCQTDKRRRKSVGRVHTAFPSRARLYADALAGEAAQADVMGKGNNSTSYEPSEVRCAFVFFLSPSRNQAFGLSASENVMHIPCPLLTASRGSSRAWYMPASERAPSRQKNLFGEAHANTLGIKTSYD